MKLTIYNGTNKPFKAMGKHQCNLLDFAFKYPTWHSHDNKKSTLNAIKALTNKNVIIYNSNTLQFKINL